MWEFCSHFQVVQTAAMAAVAANLQNETVPCIHMVAQEQMLWRDKIIVGCQTLYYYNAY